jgi:membrane protease YdiL (CAAX protease family)
VWRAAGQYLALVRLGRNQWWRYLAAVLVIVLFTEGLGALPYLWLARGGALSGLHGFIALNCGALIELGGLAIAVVLIHRRSMLSLVTPQRRIDWRRAAQGFAVWFALCAASDVIESVLFPGRYRFTFTPDTFLVFAIATLCLTPLQTATEELLFRGYVMQGLSLLVKRPISIAVISSVIFMLPHLANPEVARAPLLVPLEYLMIGLLLAAVTLKDGRLELAIGIHAANNIFNALIANYDDSVLTTEAIFTSTLEPTYSLAALPVASAAAYWILFRSRARPVRGEPTK